MERPDRFRGPDACRCGFCTRAGGVRRFDGDHDESDCRWILLSWTFHQNLPFRFVFTIFCDTFHEKQLFQFQDTVMFLDPGDQY